MNAITDAGWIEERIQKIKRGATSFVTNAFLMPGRVAAWIEAGELSGVESEAGLSLLRRDADFHHLYYFAADREALKQVLAALPSETRGTVVCDLVGRRSDVAAVLPLFEEGGFRPYVSLYRMTRMTPRHAEATDVSDVQCAGQGDVQALNQILNTAFDRYAEQIPPLAEIVAAVGNATILVVTRDATIAGFLYYETAGRTATVRYWYVAPAYRNQGIASRLMRAFFERCGKVARTILWVKADNDNAIVRYNHLGFVAEDLVDEVVLLPGSGK